MEKKDIEELRVRVGCAAVLEHEGFTVDVKESTRRAVKFRRDDDIVIVIHEDRGWFDARSNAKGDVFALASYLLGVGFSDALLAVGDLVAFRPTAPAWKEPVGRGIWSLSMTAGNIGSCHGARPRPGAISGKIGRCHGRSFLRQSKRASCAKDLMDRCGQSMSMKMALLSVGRSAG